MMKNKISQYVRTMFEESRDGELTVGDENDQYDCPVEWDEQTAEMLAQRCGELIGHLTELSWQYDKLLTETRHLTKAQFEIWNTYLRPFPSHGLDMEVLQSIWEKFETDAHVTGALRPVCPLVCRKRTGASSRQSLRPYSADQPCQTVQQAYSAERPGCCSGK